jgi:hypothetical protein
MRDKNSEMKHVESIANAMRSLMDQVPNSSGSSGSGASGSGASGSGASATPLGELKPLSTLQTPLQPTQNPSARAEPERGADSGAKTSSASKGSGPKSSAKLPDLENARQSKQSQAKPSQAKPSQAKPSQAKPSRSEKSNGKRSQAKQGPTASVHANAQAAQAPSPEAVASPLSRLSLQLGRALADIRRGQTVESSAPPPPVTNVPANLESLSDALEKCLFALEDEAEQSRHVILEELGRFDSAQRQIIGEAHRLMTAFQENAAQWLDHEQKTLQRTKDEIASKEALFKRIIEGEN